MSPVPKQGGDSGIAQQDSHVQLYRSHAAQLWVRHSHDGPSPFQGYREVALFMRPRVSGGQGKSSDD